MSLYLQIKEHALGHFLTSPLPPFSDPPATQWVGQKLITNTEATPIINVSSSEALTVPDARGGTTKIWSEQLLSNVHLSVAREWRALDILKDFSNAIKGLGGILRDWMQPAVPPVNTCHIPFTEGDIVAAMRAQVFDVVFHIFKDITDKQLPGLSWLPDVTRGALAEIGMKVSLGLHSQSYVNKSVAGWNPRDHPGASNHGVRTDEIYVLRMSEDETRKSTRSLTARYFDPVVSQKYVHPVSEKKKKSQVTMLDMKFLERKQIWGLGDCQTLDWQTLRTLFKALLPVEIKRYKSLHRFVFDWIGQHYDALGHTDEAQHVTNRLRTRPLELPDGTNGDPADFILSTLSMIRQALRYTQYYDTPYVLITDYACAILLHAVDFGSIEAKQSLNEKTRNMGLQASKSTKALTLPPDTARSEEPSKLVRWSYVKQSDIRLLTTALVYNSCQEIDKIIKDALDRGEKPVRMPLPQAKT